MASEEPSLGLMSDLTLLWVLQTRWNAVSQLKVPEPKQSRMDVGRHGSNLLWSTPCCISRKTQCVPFFWNPVLITTGVHAAEGPAWVLQPAEQITSTTSPHQLSGFSTLSLLRSRQKMLPAKRTYPVGEYLESSKTHNENLCVSIQEGYWQQLKVIKHTAHWPYKFLFCNNFRETNPCL